MRYIRTKNGIIDLTTLPNLDINNRGDITWYNDTEKYGYMVNYEDIIKTADTIEELCELFVNALYPKTYDTLEELLDDMNPNDFYKIKKCGIYGAIHIKDKGLIYVAKMNDKGELELL